MGGAWGGGSRAAEGAAPRSGGNRDLSRESRDKTVHHQVLPQ